MENGVPPKTHRLLDAMIGISSSNSAWLRLIYVTIKHMWSCQVILNAEWEMWRMFGTNFLWVGLYVLVPNSDIHLICSWYWIYEIPRSIQPPDLEIFTANIFSLIAQIGLRGHASSREVLWVVPLSSKLFSPSLPISKDFKFAGASSFSIQMFFNAAQRTNL